jgi:hypothetical protein
VFNFLGGKLEFKQALFHSCLPFPKNLGQVIHFCKSNWANLIEINLKFLPKNLSVVAYCHAFERAWPKQAP